VTPVLYASPPAVGDAEPAHLYADLQSRTLWLGVDPLVNPVGAVLISDIVALQAADAAATVYTNQQVATRALTVHTHTASQITDFNAAVAAAIVSEPDVSLWVRGMILMWSGSLVEIGVGPLLGWALCDGENDTPDLRDRFVISAGAAVNPGDVNSTAAAETNLTGDHVHTVSPHALTEAQMPAHTHTVSGTGSGVALAPGSAHAHAVLIQVHLDGYTSGPQDNGMIEGGGILTEIDGAHTHDVTVSSITATAASKGLGQSHTHTLSNPVSLNHKHTVSSTNLRNAIPYYALAFIMKL